MVTLKTTLIALAIAALPGFALAQTPAPGDPGARIDQRQANQQKRIDEGVKSGELTQKEAARLRADQERIQRMEDKARADGKVDKREARQIERAQDRESKDIARQRSDNQRAVPAQTPPPPHDGRRDGHKAGSRIDQRQAEQQRRIDEGVRRGELTPNEATRLRNEQARIQRMEDKARADGKLNPEERRRIDRELDQLDQAIMRERNDRQRAK
jgi:polyhydroxyalkanoate synthesis regulator phasin